MISSASTRQEIEGLKMRLLQNDREAVGITY